jgi:hypothetical protein
MTTITDRTAVAALLRDYRRERRYSEPYWSAKALRDHAAHYLAEQVLHDRDLTYAREQYQVAARLHEAVTARAAVGTAFADKTTTEQFWSTGKLAARMPS